MNGLLIEEKTADNFNEETEGGADQENVVENDTVAAEPSLDTSELQSKLNKYKYEFLDQEVMDWATLSHISAGIWALVKAKNLLQEKEKENQDPTILQFETYAISRLKCLEKNFKGIVSSGPRKFDTTSSLNVNMSATTKSNSMNNKTRHEFEN